MRQINIDKKVLRQLKDADAALIYSLLCQYEERRGQRKGDWFPVKYKEITGITFMGLKRLRTSINTLKGLGIVRTKMAGLPAVQHFCINRDGFDRIP